MTTTILNCRRIHNQHTPLASEALSTGVQDEEAVEEAPIEKQHE
jgi:hypothetical protein